MQRRFAKILVWGVLVLAWIGFAGVARAEITSNDYVLEQPGWRPMAGSSGSSDWDLQGSGGYGQTGSDSSDNALAPGGTERAILPTPPAPTLIKHPSQSAALQITILLGSNDPHVQAQVVLSDSSGERHYYNPSGQPVGSGDNTWFTYAEWGGSSGASLTGLNTDRSYQATVRLRADPFTLSEPSSESATVDLQQTIITGIQSGVTDLVNNIGGTIKDVIKSLVQAGGNLIDNIKQLLTSDLVQQLAEGLTAVLAPLTALIVASQLATISGTVLQLILQLLLRLIGSFLTGLQALAFFGHRKAYGEVLDGQNRRPVVGAIVSLIKPDTKRLLESQTTDQDGRYQFFVDERTSYLIRVEKEKYGVWEKVARGSVNFRIMLGLKLEFDLEALQRRQRLTAAIGRLNKIRIPLLLIGTVAWAIIFIDHDRSLLSYLLGFYYVLAWILELLVERQPRPYGLIRDAATGVTLPTVVVRISNTEGRIVETLIGDERGRFRTLISPGVYNFQFSKQGYRDKTLSGINITRSALSLEVTADLEPLTPVNPEGDRTHLNPSLPFSPPMPPSSPSPVIPSSNINQTL